MDIYKCEHCNKTYTSKGGIKYHLKKNHNQPIFTFGPSYKRENNLKKLDKDWFEMQNMKKINDVKILREKCLSSSTFKMTCTKYKPEILTQVLLNSGMNYNEIREIYHKKNYTNGIMYLSK